MRKIFAVSLVLGFVLLMSAPALAQGAPDARITAPGDGAAIGGGTTVRAEGSAATGVNRIELFIEDKLVASKDPSELRQNLDIEYSWDTTRTLDGSGLSRNGWYQIRVRVVAAGGSTDATRNVRVDNGASAPQGVSVSVAEQTVSLSWNANPEPDIDGYRVEADKGAGFATVGTTGSTSYSYQAEPGTYSWRVIALRSSVVYEGGKPSDVSSSVSATVAAPAPTSGSGSGAGKGGVNGSNEKVFGNSNKAAKKYIRETQQRFARGFGGFASAGLSLPGAAIGLPNLPDSDVLEWGTYKNKLPYSIPKGGIALESTELKPLAAPTTTHVMPLDALRLVAAGLLMVVTAGLLQFLSLRAETKEVQQPA